MGGNSLHNPLILAISTLADINLISSIALSHSCLAQIILSQPLQWQGRTA